MYVFFWLFWYITPIFSNGYIRRYWFIICLNYKKIGESGKLFVFFSLFKCSDLEVVENCEVFRKNSNKFFFLLWIGSIFLWAFFIYFVEYANIYMSRTCVNIKLKSENMYLNYLEMVTKFEYSGKKIFLVFYASSKLN